jgi:hypothetical protein
MGGPSSDLRIHAAAVDADKNQAPTIVKASVFAIVRIEIRHASQYTTDFYRNIIRFVYQSTCDSMEMSGIFSYPTDRVRAPETEAS